MPTVKALSLRLLAEVHELCFAAGADPEDVERAFRAARQKWLQGGRSPADLAKVPEKLAEISAILGEESSCD